MGFMDARARLIDALRSGAFDYEYRTDMQSRNLLWAGEVDAAFVVGLLQRCDGTEYRTSRHHVVPADCHIFTPNRKGERWYVKAYFDVAGAMFISVHR